MAEADEKQPTLPPRGKVQEVRKQWSVHEDGALAYRIQNDEINQHYGLNRFNRRTVREDIPVAKIVQSEEELRLQEERMLQLQALRAQAEEDEKVAKQMSRLIQDEVVDAEVSQTLDDEEIARQLQEKEKKKYERHLEKKREKRLKQERLRIEAELAKDTEEARLTVGSDGGSENAESVESFEGQGVMRVTPSGRIEDDGDFSDFYNLPSEMDEFTRLEIQASQDEELARLLQEQEHKRSKAEVDQTKLRKIEQQDEQLARIMQEQEKLRLKKAKQKHQQKKEAQRLKAAESLPLGASANTMNQTQLQHSPVPHSASVPIDNSGMPGHRYRRNSYTQAFDSPPSPPRSQPPPRPQPQQGSRPGSSGSNQQYSTNRMPQQPGPVPLSSSIPSPRSAGFGPGGGMSTLESARRIAAGDHEGILAAQSQAQQNHLTYQPSRGGSLQERSSVPRDGNTHTDVVRSHSHQQPGSNIDPRLLSNPQPRQPPSDYNHNQQLQPHHYQQDLPAHLQDADAAEVDYWLRMQERERQQQHLHGSGSYEGSGSDDEPHGSFSNGSVGFNIATAIDPTYQRRHPEASNYTEETQLKSHIPFSRSLPQNDGDLEWDPGLRGSLRKTKAPILNYQDSTVSSSVSQTSSIDPVMSSLQPVQGQRRGESKQRKGKSGTGASIEKKDKSNCKHQ